ncbi:Gti1/Pac2 family-domain-containing protein [Crassisporium funariophilum]|nr:Gti1/Pac2 family-domain-containing protein [Crassisporium funariophilum]
MQQATHQRLHLRDAHDAHVLFEAVRQGFLRPIVRRLNEMERAVLIRPGAIFVWFESEDENGLKRWTDGRVWGQSRMREPYLFYDEKMPYDPAQAANDASRGPTFRFVDGVARGGPSSSALSHQDRATNHHPGLVKQAYSAWVMVKPNTRPQKWHLTAYFTYAELPQLPTIDRDINLRTIIVPSGIYRSGKTRSRDDEDEPSGSGGGSNPHGEQMLPSLSTIHSNVGGPYPPGPSAPRPPHGQRLPEDQRLIQMLNSRHVR